MGCLSTTAPEGSSASVVIPESRYLLLYHKNESRLVPLLDGGSIVIGRGETSDIAFDDERMSRAHARISAQQGRIFIEDLGSRNGTRIDGVEVRERVELSFGSVVSAGGVLVTLQGKSGPVAGRVESHARFVELIGEELARSQTLGGSFALIMLAAEKGRDLLDVPSIVLGMLRKIDRLGIYSRERLEVLLPGMTKSEAVAFAARLLGRPELKAYELRAGVACRVEDGTTIDALIEAARLGVEQATRDAPCVARAPGAANEASLASAQLDRIVVSEPMSRVMKLVDRVASSSLSVLITGETGTGKEVVAKAIYEASKRRKAPFRVLNCGSIPPQLVESLLFGHEKGVFTGAISDHVGLFESARGGTVFLDEVGELPAVVQVALLRVLETNRIVRVGSTHEIEVDVRVIAATHRDLGEMCRAGNFREDLLHRLNTFTIEVPPLRNRAEDIRPLVQAFVARANRANEKTVRGLTADAWARIFAHRWPGNVRELRNVIERAVVIAEGPVIDVADLPQSIAGSAKTPPAEIVPPQPATSERTDFRVRVACFEADLIRDALAKTKNNRNAAARLLNMPVRTLSHKIRFYGITRA